MKYHIFLIFLISSLVFTFEMQGTTTMANITNGFMTNRIIVKYCSSSGIASNMDIATVMLNRVVNLQGASMRYLHSISNEAQVWELNKMMLVDDVRAITDQIALDPSVEYAEPDIMMRPMSTHKT